MIAIMSSSLLDRLIAGSTLKKSVPKGRHLFHRGDQVQFIFVVLEGCLNLVRIQNDGDMAVLQRATAGTIFAEASLFTDRYHCDGVASAASKVAGVPVGDVRNLLNSQPGFAMAWSMHLSNELQNSRKRSEIATLRTVSARLDAWIAWNDDGRPAKGEWRQVAAEIGVSPEALYRELAKRRARQHRKLEG